MKLAIVGYGTWATTMAAALGRKYERVRDVRIAWWISPESRFEGQHLLDVVVRTGENRKRLPGVPIPSNVHASGDLAEVAADANVLIWITPAAYTKALLLKLAPIADRALVLHGIKGFDPDASDLKTMSMMFGADGGVDESRIGVLSGPNIAPEIAGNFTPEPQRRWAPVAAVVASATETAARQLAELVEIDGVIRAYTTRDVRGVELCGILKHIYAIAAGVCDGMGMPHSTKASLKSRSIAEMKRILCWFRSEMPEFGSVCDETLDSPAGLGDLDVSCMTGRNHTLGRSLAQGMPTAEVNEKVLRGMVAEGIHVVRRLCDCLRDSGLRTPILSEVHQMVWEGKPADQAIGSVLHSRRPAGPCSFSLE